MIEQIKKGMLEGVNVTHPLLTKIKALLKAYECEYDFCSFYKGENVVISRYYDSCIIYIYGDCNINEVIRFIEIYGFTFVQCNKTLNMYSNYIYTSGNIYQYNNDNNNDAINKLEFNNSIKDCFNIVGEYFYSDFNKEQYERWYTNMSHRIRHGVSKVYSIEEKSSVTLYACDDNIAILSQIATKENYRRQGLAKDIIRYVCAENKGKQVVLYSKDANSDSFYKKIGFNCVGLWHNYDKVEESND